VDGRTSVTWRRVAALHGSSEVGGLGMPQHGGVGWWGYHCPTKSETIRKK
jgi:hypothetical protein